MSSLKLCQEFVVKATPSNTDYRTLISRFERGASDFKSCLSLDNFLDTSRLKVGSTYYVKIWQIPDLRGWMMLGQIKKERCLLVGLRGLLTAYAELAEKLPKGVWYISPDNENALFSSDVYPQIPGFGINSDTNSTRWQTSDFDQPYGVTCRLITFSPVEPSEWSERIYQPDTTTDNFYPTRYLQTSCWWGAVRFQGQGSFLLPRGKTTNFSDGEQYNIHHS